MFWRVLNTLRITATCLWVFPGMSNHKNVKMLDVFYCYNSPGIRGQFTRS